MKTSSGIILGALTLANMASAQPLPPDTLWTRIYGFNGYDKGYAVQQTNDGGYIVGGYSEFHVGGSSDAILLKTDAIGHCQWFRRYGGSYSEYGYSCQQTTDLGYILAGGTSSYGLGSSDAFLLKTDSLGNRQWFHAYGSNLYECIYSVCETADGGYIAVGEQDYSMTGDAYMFKTDSQGMMVWELVIAGPSSERGLCVQQINSGDYIFVGETWSQGSGNGDVYLVKVDQSGHVIWSRTFGGQAVDWGNSIRQTADNGFIIAGFTQPAWGEEYDAIIIKTDPDGNEIWQTIWGGSGDEGAAAILQTFAGDYVFCGRTTTYSSGGWADACVVKLDPQGREVWRQIVGGEQWDNALDIQQISDGGFIFCGTSMVSGPHQYDLYLVRLESDYGTQLIGDAEPRATNTESNNNRLSASPNSFNPSTVLSFQLRDASHVSLTVYDTAGRLVTMLVDGWREAGVHEVTFDGSGLAAGIYIYRLQAGDFTRSGKMALIK